MTTQFPVAGKIPEFRQEITRRLAAVFETMDEGWHEVAVANHFRCTGCADNCCETRFHHHTVAEWLMLKDGLDALPDGVRGAVTGRAKDWISAMEAADAEGVPFRRMCPANEDGNCLIYAHRPMICRLHGLAWKMTLRGQVQEAPGCGLFDEGAPEPPVLLDRTPFYQAMAEVERFARNKTGYAEKLRLTIAEMVVALEEVA